MGCTLWQVTLVDFRAAQTRVRPSGMREVALELPKVTWADVGGHSSIKQRLKEAVEWPQKHPETLARMGAKASYFMVIRRCLSDILICYFCDYIACMCW